MPHSRRICGFSSIFQRLTLVSLLRRGGGVLGILAGDGADERSLLPAGQPFGVLDPGIQEEVHRDADDHGEQAFEAKEPLPAAESEGALEAEQHSGDGSGQGSGNRGTGNEDGGGLAPLAGRNPPGEIEDDGGEEPGLSRAEQEPQHVEHHFVLHERHQEGNDAPADHDPGEPDPGAELLHHHVAGQFKDRVGDEEQAGSETVGRGADSDIRLQVLVGVADV